MGYQDILRATCDICGEQQEWDMSTPGPRDLPYTSLVLSDTRADSSEPLNQRPLSSRQIVFKIDACRKCADTLLQRFAEVVAQVSNGRCEPQIAPASPG